MKRKLSNVSAITKSGWHILAVAAALSIVALYTGSSVCAAARQNSRVAVDSHPSPLKVNSTDGAEMVFVPAGRFTMGESGYSDAPAHDVYLRDGYYIYKNDVTVAQYQKFCAATSRSMPAPPPWGWTKQDFPMVNVTWDDAAAYAKWAGVSLPTEAQWEKAARGTDGRKFPWGNLWNPSNCRHSGDHFGDGGGPISVGSYPAGASPYGALDMAGNVWQWCSDWYDAGYYGHSPKSNPSGPANGTVHVMRGGSWVSAGVYYMTCAERSSGKPDYTNTDVGFRCVVRQD